jgi:hypothetical protein
MILDNILSQLLGALNPFGRDEAHTNLECGICCPVPG